MYGKKFADQWSGIDPESLKQCWAEELAGYSGEEIRRGLDVCKTQVWPPSLPEFLMFCRPAIDLERSFLEAVRGCAARRQGTMGTWSSPRIFWAAQEFGAFDLLEARWDRSKARWAAALDAVGDDFRPIPEPALRLEAPAPTNKKFEIDLKALRVTKNPGDKIDHKRWAKKLIARHESGEMLWKQELTMARAALGIDDGGQT